jgi:hypothetical protein
MKNDDDLPTLVRSLLAVERRHTKAAFEYNTLDQETEELR